MASQKLHLQWIQMKIIISGDKIQMVGGQVNQEVSRSQTRTHRVGLCMTLLSLTVTGLKRVQISIIRISALITVFQETDISL
jgi:hypothetical protein